MRGWLLDTNVLSELARPRPDRKVTNFISTEAPLWISVVSLAELERGINRMDHSKKKLTLSRWYTHEFRAAFAERVIDVDLNVVNALLDLGDTARSKRFAPDVADALIAATALANDLTIATRNVKDLRKFGLPVFNPFTGERFNGA